MMPLIKRDKAKLKALVHYIAHRFVESPVELGAIKLNKALWYSDLFAYLAWGAPITGARYIKKPFGPVASDLMPIADELEREMKVVRRRRDKLGGEHVEYLSLKTPDTSPFKTDELRLVEDILQIVCRKHTAASISLASHDIVWELTEMDQEIPYHAMLASDLHEVTSDDLAWARAQIV